MEREGVNEKERIEHKKVGSAGQNWEKGNLEWKEKCSRGGGVTAVGEGGEEDRVDGD